MHRWGRRLLFIVFCVVFIYIIYFSVHSYNSSVSYALLGVLKWYNYSVDGLNGPSISADNPELISKIRSKFLIAPSTSLANHQYVLSNPGLMDPSMGQSAVVRKYLKNKRNGVFIECGAMDGETRSNTLYMERYLNWTGLLIEADPLNFAEMVVKNRRAWLSPTCLSVQPYPEIVSFEQNNNMGKISVFSAGSKRRGHVDVQCFPIYSYFLALNFTTVDYFSLDVEGAELDVLKTIPFDKVDIKVLSVEFIHVPGGKEALKEFMEDKGYKIQATVTHPNWLANDFIFVKS